MVKWIIPLSHNPYFTKNSLAIVLVFFFCCWSFFFYNPCFSGNLFTIQDKIYIELKQKTSQSLFQWKPFTIEGFDFGGRSYCKVTILVLVETPLQYKKLHKLNAYEFRHNPCFSGNLFTIERFDRYHPKGGGSQSLFQWKPLYNIKTEAKAYLEAKVTILVLVETSLQQKQKLSI